ARQLDNADAARECRTARRRVDSSLRDQRMRSQISEISVQFVGSICRVQWDAHRARLHSETRYRHLWTIRQHDGDPVMTAYPHGPQRALRLVDVLIQTAEGQRHAPRSENRRRVGNMLGLMFQQVREGRKRNGGTRVYGTSDRHGSQPILDGPQAWGLRIA